MDTATFAMTKASQVLRDVATIWTQRWPDRITNTPFVVVTAHMNGSPDALVDHVRRGGHAALCCSPTGTAALPFITEDVFEPFVGTGMNPLVVADEVVAAGIGPLEGIEVTADQASAVRAGVPVLVVGDQALAATLTVGSGTITLIGSAGLFADGLLTTSGNVDMLWWAATGSRRTPVVRYPSTPQAPHPGPVTVSWGDHPGFTGYELTMRSAAHAARELPPPVHDALCDFVDTGNPSGALLVRGVPFGDIPDTPPYPTAPDAHHHMSEFTLLTMARRIGQPVGYLPEHGGDLVQNIVPVRTAATRQVSTSSAVTLMWHTEAAFHPHRPRFVLLGCLRGDPSAATLVSSIESVVSALPDDVLETLRRPLFVTCADESYVSEPRPVLIGSRHRPQLIFDADLMSGIDGHAQRALAVLGETIDQVHGSVTLTSGDVLVIDNHRAVHGRSPYTPRFDRTDRWLKRTFAVADLDAAACDLEGRIVATRFRTET
jgi:L-asparagine oxygenase